jgi:hypothetical protein
MALLVDGVSDISVCMVFPKAVFPHRFVLYVLILLLEVFRASLAEPVKGPKPKNNRQYTGSG